jgi:hypothetical protein
MVSKIKRCFSAIVLGTVLILLGCDTGTDTSNNNNNNNNTETTTVNITGTPRRGQNITATVNGKFYGDISWLWSWERDFMASAYLGTGPSRVITVPNVVYSGGVARSSTGIYIRARVDKAGNGDYVYSNIIGPVTN